MSRPSPRQRAWSDEPRFGAGESPAFEVDTRLAAWASRVLPPPRVTMELDVKAKK